MLLRLVPSIPRGRVVSPIPCAELLLRQQFNPTRCISSSAIPQNKLLLSSADTAPRLSLTFTCTVPDCSSRSTHQFSKASYEKGIVIVQCPKCKNRHLIADHLGWFKDAMGDGKYKTIEELLKSKGEKVKRGRIDAEGVIEFGE